MKSEHEFRDPIHGFITCSTMERKVIDSVPFQRLRHIHQLAMTFLVYPGATHKRFEHSLGVMELASRVFDVLTKEDNWKQLPEEVKQNIPELNEKQSLGQWRLTVRMAALCHDMGHLPFSHATEGMLPSKTTHEHMTWKIVTENEQMLQLWKLLRLEPITVAKLAVGQKELPDGYDSLTTWENLLSEIIVDAVAEIFDALCSEFAPDELKLDIGMKKKTEIDFPVMRDGAPGAPLQASQEIPSINLVPNVETGYIFASPTIKDKVKKHLEKHVDEILDAQTTRVTP